MSTQTPIPKEHPLWKAWEKYQSTPEFTNTKYWAAMPEHSQGSLWAAFEQGWNAYKEYAQSTHRDLPVQPGRRMA